MAKVSGLLLALALPGCRSAWLPSDEVDCGSGTRVDLAGHLLCVYLEVLPEACPEVLPNAQRRSGALVCASSVDLPEVLVDAAILTAVQGASEGSPGDAGAGSGPRDATAPFIVDAMMVNPLP